MRRILRISVLGTVLALAAWPAAAARQPAAARPAALAQDRDDAVVRPANFDDASTDDLAVGAPGETVGGVAGAGAVSLFDGTATATGREWLLHAGLANSPPVEPPGETVGGARGAGAATIVYGHQYFENQALLYQGHGGIGGTPEAGDAFGAAVA
jgi:hypothetical protein